MNAIIGIFCGSRSGTDPLYEAAAYATGRQLAQSGAAIVYGGGRAGLMGAVADGALAHGGRVIGVIPGLLVEQELAHSGLSDLYVVDTMHERKAKMAELASGFIALPGGVGTLEEIFEQWTWGQLGIHRKPCAFLNINGYFDPLLTMIDKMVAEGFVQQRYADSLVFSDRIETVVNAFRTYVPPTLKWVTEAGAAEV
ncbi:MAG: TIGR00730 family Rossman fold protein [Ancalomicrobiaceae bacterium]|nr:TIGR00730 family Rossman fold protein [Ancalomicrobiaceae bacterium]